jgi:hypothetical protein
MDDREKVAHHEAAHVVMSVQLGASVPGQGIDIDAPSSVEGAYGNAWVNIFAQDPNPEEDEQIKILRDNLAIVCAGIASDAKLMGRSLREALSRQPSDEQLARELLGNSPLVDTKELQEYILDGVLRFVERAFEDKIIWSAVQEIARACIKEGGRLSKSQIEQIVARTLVSEPKKVNS